MKVALKGVAVTVTVAACVVKVKVAQSRNILFIVLTTGLIDQIRDVMKGGLPSPLPAVCVMILP